jgi:hypothetical protein
MHGTLLSVEISFSAFLNLPFTLVKPVYKAHIGNKPVLGICKLIENCSKFFEATSQRLIATTYVKHFLSTTIHPQHVLTYR